MGTDEEMIWVISGISLQDPLRPVKATAIEMESSAEEEEEDGHCSTPTKKEARIAERLMCPPAPKKPKPALMCHLDGVEFFSPPDLDSVFIRRAQSAK